MRTGKAVTARTRAAKMQTGKAVTACARGGNDADGQSSNRSATST